MTSTEKQNDFYIELGNRIRQARLKVRIGQDELAEKLSLTRSSIVNIEKGRQRPMIHTIVTISQLLKTDLNSLIPGQTHIEVIPHESDYSSWTDFSNVVSDEFTLDTLTQNTIKEFVKHIKK